VNTVLTPPPERDLPAAARRRRRADLVAMVAADERPRRRHTTPLLAAAAVATVIAGLAVAVPALRDSGTPADRTGTPEPAGQATTAETPVKKKIVPARAHDLTPAEMAEFWQDCRTAYAGMPWPEPFDGYRSVAGVRFAGKARVDQAAAWLITVKEGQYWVCIANSRGEVIGNAGFGPRTLKDVPYLFAPVDGRGSGMGVVTRPVVRVTVQGKDTAEQEAVIRHGFWFVPFDDQRYVRFDKNTSMPTSDNHLIGVAPGYTFRGYDAAGRQVYNSATQGPDVRRCYTDPSGRQVRVHNGVNGGNPDPSTCRRMFSWRR
jgi:hypothetical protein